VAGKRGTFDTVLVTYEIQNKGDEAHTVGIRTVVDTFIGDNDGNPFAVPGKNEPITTSADFRGKKVPDFVKALQRPDLNDPGLVAHFSLKVGGGVEAPDRVCLLHWYEGSMTSYEVEINDINNEDAAIAIYWSPRELPANGRRVVGFAYGLGIVSPGQAKKGAD
jgi:hypothetical protein